MLKFILLFQIVLYLVCGDSSYDTMREKWLREKCDAQIGGKMNLTVKEKRVDEILNAAKSKLYSSTQFPPATNFLEANITDWEETSLFKLLKPFPKGAVLHIHVDAQLTGSFIVEKATYDSDCFLCGDIMKKQDITFRYFEDEYVNQSSCNHDAGWRRVNDLRDKYGDSVEFDRLLSQSMTIYLPENKRYDDVFPTVNDAWNSFQPIFTVMHGLFLFRPFHEIYADESMRLLREDNVQYVELRADLVDFVLYEKNQTEHTDIFMSIWEKAAKKYDIGVKFIQTTLRQSDPDVVESKLARTKELREENSNIVAFDLVGQEDPGRPLIDFVDVFENEKYQDILVCFMLERRSGTVSMQIKTFLMLCS